MNKMHFRNREEWHEWLAANHDQEKEVRMVFYKKHTKTECIVYEDAIREALCFGWIDSVLNSLDDETYMLKFSPRNPRSVWSDLNKSRVLELIADGKMTEAGMKAITFDLEEAARKGGSSRKRPVPDLPEEYMKILQEHPVSFQNYLKMSKSHKRQYTGYILEAKKEETRLRRLDKVIEMLKEDKRTMF